MPPIQQQTEPSAIPALVGPLWSFDSLFPQYNIENTTLGAGSTTPAKTSSLDTLFGGINKGLDTLGGFADKLGGLSRSVFDTYSAIQGEFTDAKAYYVSNTNPYAQTPATPPNDVKANQLISGVDNGILLIAGAAIVAVILIRK